MNIRKWWNSLIKKTTQIKQFNYNNLGYWSLLLIVFAFFSCEDKATNQPISKTVQKINLLTFSDTVKRKNKNNGINMKQDKLTKFGNDYTKAWNSQKPENVASFFAEEGALIVNGGKPLTGRNEITAFANGFMSAFPDMKLTMDSLVTTSNDTEYHWNFVGTNTGPEGTGNKVLFSGFERWTFSEGGLIKVSIGTFDEEEYSRQVKGENKK